MTWSARIEHTPAGLALTFGAPLSRLDMAPDVAQHLASLLAVEARHRLAGVVRTLVDDHESGVFRRNVEPSRGVRLITEGDRQNATSDIFLPQNMPIQVIGNAHPLCCDCDLCLNGDHHG